jgi:hypothetical protein
MIAVATVGQMLQLISNGLKFLDILVKLFDVLPG